MKIIVGLGNPDTKYVHTRHNIGWMVLNMLRDESQEWQHSKNADAYYIWTEVNDEEIELIKPTTYMNRSGKTIQYVLKKHPKLTPQNFIIVHDEVDIEFGKVKVSQNATSAGHNGVASIISALGSKDFTRIRVGVGKSNTIPTEKFVLQKFTPDEQEQLPTLLEKAAKATHAVITQPISEVQNKFH